MANTMLHSLFYVVILILQQTDFIKANNSECGTSSAIGNISGLIISHNGFGSSLYPNKLNCTWSIQPPATYEVKLKFIVFDVEDSTRCSKDNLLISYGQTRHNFCGSAVPSAITSSSNVQLTFTTDENTESLGFLIRYTYFRNPSPLRQCNVLLDVGMMGSITNSNIPSSNISLPACHGLINATDGRWVILELALQMEGSVESGCPHEHLSIYDMETDKLIGRYCGKSDQIKLIPTNTSHIRIEFVSDGQNTQSAFVLNWHTVKANASSVRAAVTKVLVSSTTTLQTKSQSTSTPSHQTLGASLASNALQYPATTQTDSVQSIPTSSSSVTTNTIQSQIITAGLSPAPSTLKHQMKTQSASSSTHFTPVSSSATTSFQRSSSPSASSTNQPLLTGRSINTVVANACSSLIYLNGSAGSITLPLQPNGEYFPNLDCQWLLVGEPGANMIVNFESFQLETSTDCKKDYLAFYDGDSEVSRMVAKYCGKDLPDSVIATANKMFIKFHSDQSVQSKGILLQYLQMTPVTVPTLPVYHCPKDVVEMKSESGVLTSIGFTGYTNYSPNLNCQWQITTKPGKVLQLRFLDFETEYAVGCQYDHVEIWDGSLGNRTLLGKYCGIRLPRDVTTQSNTVYIKFMSDAAVNGIGFNLTYHTIDKIVSCTKDQYKCLDGSCIDKSLVCNNKTDCPDKTDELVCDVNETCGRPSIKATLQEHRIVGGEEAIRGSWPWQTTVSHKGAFMCGGSLLNPYWVITAAHCFGVSVIQREWGVGLGKHYLMQSEKGVENIGLADIIIHPEYNSHTSYNDIALLRLKQPVNITSRVSTICLPTQPQHIGQNCYVTGFGDSLDTCCPDVLKQAMVPVLNTTLCNSTTHYNGRVLDSMFCAGYTTQHIDACHGDSGGPLVSLYSDGKWYLQGIISWGIGCADLKHPGIYTGVYQFNSWIQSVVYQI